MSAEFQISQNNPTYGTLYDFFKSSAVSPSNASDRIDYNERFRWNGPDDMIEAYHSALHKGLPYPILTVVEYLSLNEEGFGWGRTYRYAGYLSGITLWYTVFSFFFSSTFSFLRFYPDFPFFMFCVYIYIYMYTATVSVVHFVGDFFRFATGIGMMRRFLYRLRCVNSTPCGLPKLQREREREKKSRK